MANYQYRIIDGALFRREPQPYALLYAIILYGFEQQIRFNGSHEFNNPTGMRWFNNELDVEYF